MVLRMRGKDGYLRCPETRRLAFASYSHSAIRSILPCNAHLGTADMPIRVRELANQIKAGLEREWTAWEVHVLQSMAAAADEVWYATVTHLIAPQC